MKNLKRIIAVAALLACLFSLCSLEAFAYNGEVFERKNDMVSSVTCRVKNNGWYYKETTGWFGIKKVQIALPALTIKNTCTKKNEPAFDFTLSDCRGKVLKKGTLKRGQSVSVNLPTPVECKKPGCDHSFTLLFDQASAHQINYSVTVSGNVGIWQTSSQKLLSF